MATFSQAKGAAHYPCPMCGTPISSSAVYCPTCATDLTRAGTAFTSSGTPVQSKRKRSRAGLWIVVVAATALGVAGSTAGRAWVAQVTEPGLAVLHSIVRSALRSVRGPAAPPGDRAKVQTKAAAPAVTPAKPAAPAKSIAPAPARRPATAILTVSSMPRGARVQIDGVAKGVTPLTIRELRPGAHKIRISHQGYQSVTRSVTLDSGKVQAVGINLPARVLPSVARPAAKPAPVPPQEATLLAVGRLAPQFVAKDRLGLLYRPADFRGRKLLLVFVQTLDGNAQRIIRELNALHASGARGAAVVVVLRPDRAVIRQFTRTEQIQIPVLFGTQTLGRAYGVGPQPAVLYLVSEEGRVMLRQAGRVNPRAALN